MSSLQSCSLYISLASGITVSLSLESLDIIYYADLGSQILNTLAHSIPTISIPSSNLMIPKDFPLTGPLGNLINSNYCTSYTSYFINTGYVGNWFIPINYSYTQVIGIIGVYRLKILCLLFLMYMLYTLLPNILSVIITYFSNMYNLIFNAASMYARDLNTQYIGVYRGLSIGGVFGYLIFGGLYDYICINLVINGNYSSNRIIRLLQMAMHGFIYFMMIIDGILTTNSQWYLIQNRLRPMAWAFIGAPCSVFFSTLWFWYADLPLISRYNPFNVFFRIVFEFFSFLSIVIFTYAIGFYWSLINVPNLSADTLGLIVGGISYLLLSLIIALLELNRQSGFWYSGLYGLVFTLWWTSAVIFTNPIINYMLAQQLLPWQYVLIIIGGGIASAALSPNFYPADNRRYLSGLPYVFFVRSDEYRPEFSWLHVAFVIAQIILISGYVLSAAIIQTFFG